MAKTDYSRWIMHLHLGVKGIPLTVYPTDRRGIVTVIWGKTKWNCIPKAEAAILVGKAILRCRGNVRR